MNIYIYKLILTFIFLFFLASCDEPYSLVDILDGEETRSNENSLALLPESATLAYGEALTFVAAGGTAPYSYSLVNSGSVDPSLDGSTGDYVSGNTTGIDIVRVTDSEGFTRDSSVTVTSLASNVDYDSITVNNTGGSQGGGALAGTFSFENNGTDNGTQTLSWSLYLSLDTTIGAGDILADSGTTSFLNASGASAPIPFSGNWPVPGTETEYHLIISLSAADETDYSDNQGIAAVTVTIPPPADIDYFVQSITYTASPFETGSSISQSFIFSNGGTDAGLHDPYWSVYFSKDDELDGTDVLADSGSFTNLLLGVGGNRNINIDGNWPSSSGIYYLIVTVTSADDVNSFNDALAQGPFTVNTTTDIVDYAVSGLTADYTNISSGDFCSETFDITNLGGRNGAFENAISWTAYASPTLNGSLDTDNDPVINSSSGSDLSALNSGSGYVDIPIGGTWPAASGSYTLYVQIEADDDLVTGNNTISTGPYILSEPPDYTISCSPLLTAGTPGAALGSSGDFSFVISETAGAAGNQRIGWEIYASWDAVLDISDERLAYGDMAPLGAGISTPDIPFHDSLWPAMGSYYYLIIKVRAGDDINGNNDVWVSPDPFVVPFVYTEGGEDNSYDNNLENDSSLVSPLGPTLTDNNLSPYELILIEGTTDNKNVYDTYSFILDGGVNSLDVNVAWSFAGLGNEIDMFIWDGAGGSWASEDSSDYVEPSAPPLTITGLTGGAAYYTGINFTAFITNDILESYDVYIYGRP